MVEGYEGEVAFVNEDFGESELARRFGVRRYPAVFVDDVLIAKPKDFGFSGEGGSQGAGRYTPWKDPRSHERFKRDLRRMIELARSGRTEALRASGVAVSETSEPRRLPSFTARDLSGERLSSDELAGRVVLVEFWAPWCPPCLSTLEWIERRSAEWGEDVSIVTFAVESSTADVQRLAERYDAGPHWLIATPEITQSFGDVIAVPTLYLFDREGRTVSVLFGAPPDLERRIEKLVAELLR